MKQCDECSSPLKSDGNRFCSLSCAATANNRARRPRNPGPPCPNCGREKLRSRAYCSRSCGTGHKRTVFIESWKLGEVPGGSDQGVSERVRHFLMERSNRRCERKACGWDWTKTCGVEVEHINGDPTDHRFENLMVICPNCHTNTSSYKGRNRGRGRAWRRTASLDTRTRVPRAYEPKRCVDCSKQIYYGSKRCSKCHGKSRVGKNTVIEWPDDSILMEMIATTSKAQVARDLNASHSAVAKRAKRISRS